MGTSAIVYVVSNKFVLFTFFQAERAMWTFKGQSTYFVKMSSQKMLNTSLENCLFYEKDDARLLTVKISLEMFFMKLN